MSKHVLSLTAREVFNRLLEPELRGRGVNIDVTQTHVAQVGMLTLDDEFIRIEYEVTERKS